VQAGLTPIVEENARKVTFDGADLTKIIGNVMTVYAARGKKVETFNLKDYKLTSEVVRKSLFGPTGNLRAPAIRSGKNFIVGFNEELYKQLLLK
jgi:arsenate reductase-like glutaredoxin family protein